MKRYLIMLLCLTATYAMAETIKAKKAEKTQRAVAGSLKEIMQAEVSDDAVGLCQGRLVRYDLTLEPFVGPELVKEACYQYGRAILKESDHSFKMIIIKHNGEFKHFDR